MKRNKYQALIACVFSLFALPVVAADFQTGFDCYQAKNYACALKEWQPLAEQGNVEAQYKLGRMYEDGLGIAQDYAEAVKWYRKAAEQGNAFAQGDLGWMYDSGHGIAQDYAEAVKWYRKAAEQGDAFAQEKLGRMYENGRGVAQDYAEAVKWYRKAAEQGDAGAQVKLGEKYANGQGVERNAAWAIYWYAKAAQQGHKDGTKLLASAINKQPKLAVLKPTINIREHANTTSPVVATASQGDILYRLGTDDDWYKVYSPPGHKVGYVANFLVERNELSVGLACVESKDWGCAWKNLKPLADEGNADAQIQIGYIYHWVENDYSNAIYWYKKAADQGHPLGQIGIATVNLFRSAASTSSHSNQSYYPPRPLPKAGYITCNTRCSNGDCYRTYSDGRQVHFQAQQKWNPFNNLYEWDSGGC